MNSQAEPNTTRAEENFHLRQDLTNLWATHHLTNEYKMGILKSHGNDMKPCVDFFVLKNSERFEPSPSLASAITKIADAYDFTRLKIFSCGCGDCGRILFKREIDGVLCEAINDEQGNLEDAPSGGFDHQEDLQFGAR